MKNALLLAIFSISSTYASAEIILLEHDCHSTGPQSPRDISNKEGTNRVIFAPSENIATMNLCNIHTHTYAEHKGPTFSVKKTDDNHQGFQCNEANSLTAEELAPVEKPTFQGVKPGDTIEVHWVYSSCSVSPGKGLSACRSDDCLNPQLRAEAQVFLLVNDKNALNFNDFAYVGQKNEHGYHQAKSLPDGGKPVQYLGSTTGQSYDKDNCSPYQVTWNVRPKCLKLDINSLDAWGQHNIFQEHHSHAVRSLVTEKEKLSPIQE